MEAPTPPKKSHRLILPLGMRVLVKILHDEERTETGLYLPEGAKAKHEEAFYAEVIEVARDRATGDEPSENVSGIPHGAKVLFPKTKGVPVPWDDSLRLVDVKDVLATVEEHSEEEAH
ncbi:MAG: co-chaperone GroES family protein [Deltaproteobacteria bacterium]|nr:co-chaperone GroES family protein [Deltaproteobacteria bacterium]